MTVAYPSGDPQVCEVEGLVGTHYVERHLMVHVVPLASALLVLLGQQLARFSAALAALAALGVGLATGDEFVRLHQGLLGRAVVAWVREALALRRDAQHLPADITPGLTPGQGPRRNGNFGAGEADLPAIGFVPDRHGLDRAHNLTRPAHGHAATRGQ